ncbi:DAK2 domain-containing protein [Heliobacterium chlorum]|uniref:DAK2 domain-containing protein n=1 Tax=Heliobacterium chlorum TaxID=2698 RepID=A0ABR7SXR9_HELCL|nr:DAK2 domain-containing protein [Heliobacterium chlorum]MBC9783343.1 DAK2 domain-containing protein [Heliobacterium chlorum]
MFKESKLPTKDHRRLNGIEVAQLIRSGAVQVEQNRQYVDRLNVFPVPDGDTGTNLALTLQACAEAMPKEEPSVGKVASAAAKGALLGARGNSGVIFSQLFWGWAKAMEETETVSPREWAQAMEKGVERAYKAVMKPVEGTILTVAKMAAREALAAARRGSDMEEVLAAAIEAGKRALAKTPEQLPALKEAGVVDAGGQGYLFFLIGCHQALAGEAASAPNGTFEPSESPYFDEKDRSSSTALIESSPHREENMEFPYCTEFILRGQNLPLEALQESLKPLGDCLLVVGDRETAKIHVHTNHPGVVLEKALAYGSLHQVHINNMAEQANNRAEQAEAEQEIPPQRPIGFIAATPSEGWAALYREQGAMGIIDGGTSCNPSAQDWLSAVEKANADFCLLLPNHPNLIMAARQAVQMIGEDKATVIGTRHLPGGLAASLAFDPDKSVEDNIKMMEAAAGAVHSLEITWAVRDASVNGRDVKEGDLLGIFDDKLVSCGNSVPPVVLEALDRSEEEWELITIYTGENVSDEDVETLKDAIGSAYPNVEVHRIQTGQPLYPYIFGLE